MSRALRHLLLIAAACAASGVRADDEQRRSDREDAGDRVRQVERDGGRVLQAEPMQRGGREVYRIKVLTPEGRVRVIEDQRAREPRSGGDPGAGSAATVRRERALMRERPSPVRERPAMGRERPQMGRERPQPMPRADTPPPRGGGGNDQD